MVKLTIDNCPIEVPEGTTILDAAKAAGIFLPTLCYCEGINDVGACRVCVVEVEGSDRLVASCNTLAEEGMVVNTNSPRARRARKVNVELILSEHHTDCTKCMRSQTCILQSLANDLGIVYDSFDYKQIYREKPWDKTFPLIRDESKCIKCMRCVQVCNNIQQVGVWDTINSGGYTTIGLNGGANIAATNCALCGQCITHCPVGALRERDDTDAVWEALADPDKIAVVQLAPAVRAAWGEALGMPRDWATVKRLVTALKRIGFNYVFDTTLTADLTIMEEGLEFFNMLKAGDESKFPLFTSCCPGWIRFIKSNFPDMVKHLSSAKSPQQMFGSVMKIDLAKKLGVSPDKIYSVSLMPCVAKKSECALPTMTNELGEPDVDVTLTTREISRMIKTAHINPERLEESNFDELEGDGSGAGVIFGATGGVMEAALRSVYFMVTGENPDPDAFRNVRGREGWREATFEVSGVTVRIAVASGLGNARKLVEAIRRGEVSYHFVEIMACPGGCAGGGGQPITPNTELAAERSENLYYLDSTAELRFSHENPRLKEIYDRNPGIAHHLHTNHTGWKMPNEK